jgi:hypothetical protein
VTTGRDGDATIGSDRGTSILDGSEEIDDLMATPQVGRLLDLNGVR